jgi:hypothetical protein
MISLFSNAVGSREQSDNDIHAPYNFNPVQIFSVFIGQETK